MSNHPPKESPSDSLLTAWRKQEEQLLQAQKFEAIGTLAGGVAHDFHNLLTAINGYGDLCLRRLRPEDPLRHYIVEIRKAGDRAATLTRQLLASAAATKGCRRH